MNGAARRVRQLGFTLLPVVFAMSMIAAIAYLLNRDSATNAAITANQSDVDRARYAAEAGLQAANYQVQQKGCGGGFPVSGSPVINNNFGGASYSAYANQATGTTLTLTSTGTYNGTAVTLTRSNVLVFQSSRKSATLQPGPGSSQDATVDPSRPTRNYGADDRLVLDSGSEALLRFDLSSLAAGSRIVGWYNGTALQPGANLSLYQTTNSGGAGVKVSAYLLTSNWVEGTKTGFGTADGVTWNTYDGVNAWSGTGYNSAPLVTVNYSQFSNWNSWDLTNVAAAWMGTLYSNYGVRLRVSTGSINSLHYASSDDGSGGLHPTFALNYLAPCTQTLTPSADSYIDSGAVTQNFGGTTPLSVYNSGVRQTRTLLQFDFSSVPPGSTIQSAKLRLDSTAMGTPSGNTKTISAYTITQSWVEGTANGSSPGNAVTYNTRNGFSAWTAGGTYSTPSIAMATDEASGNSPPASNFSTGWIYWDLTALVKSWVAGSTNNYGVILISTVSDQPTLPSRENATAANQPQLVITYQ